MADPVDHARMAGLIVEQRQVEESLEAARRDVLLWVRRGRLAKQGERPDLVDIAKARAAEAKVQFLAAQDRLDRIRAEKDAVRRDARRPDDMPSATRAEILVEQFRMQGFSPEEQEATEVARRMEAEMAVKALRGEPVTPPAVPTESPPATSSAAPPSAEATAEVPAEDEITDEDIADLERALAEARAAKPLEPAPPEPAPPANPEPPDPEPSKG